MVLKCEIWKSYGNWLSKGTNSVRFSTPCRMLFNPQPLVCWVRCGTWLYRFLIFAPLLTFISQCEVCGINLPPDLKICISTIRWIHVFYKCVCLNIYRSQIFWKRALMHIYMENIWKNNNRLKKNSQNIYLNLWIWALMHIYVKHLKKKTKKKQQQQ